LVTLAACLPAYEPLVAWFGGYSSEIPETVDAARGHQNHDERVRHGRHCRHAARSRQNRAARPNAPLL